MRTDRVAPALDDWTINDYGSMAHARNNDLSREIPGTRPFSQGWESISEDSSAIRSESYSKHATAGSSEGGFEIVPQVSNNSTSRRESRLPCHIIPITQNKRFFGRADILQEIHDRFLPSTEAQSATEVGLANEAKTFAICGPGGMGKTQIAAEFVFSHKTRFDAIFWIYSDTSDKIYEGFCKVALELGLVDRDSVDSHDGVVARELVKGWLANPLKSENSLDVKCDDRAYWLLVLDNADRLEEIDDILPLDGPGCVLLTSRDPLAKQFNYSGMTGIDLKPFNSDEGDQLLTSLTGKEGDSDAIVKLLGGLPLAMTQMAGIIVRRDLTFAEFTKAYTEEEGRREMLQLDLALQSRRTKYEHTIASVWALDSLRHGRALLEVLSFLDPDGIPEMVLTTTLKSISLVEFPKTLFAYQTARTELLQSSLITKTVDTVQIHRLVQDAARTQLDKSSIKRVFSVALALVASVWPFEAFGWRHGIARWDVCEQILPQVLALQHHRSRMNITHDSFKENFQLAKLLTDAGWYYDLRFCTLR